MQNYIRYKDADDYLMNNFGLIKREIGHYKSLERLLHEKK